MKIYLVTPDTTTSTGLSTYAQALVKYTPRNFKDTPVEIQLLAPSPASLFSKAFFSLFGLDWPTLKKSYPFFWSLPNEGIIHFTNQQQGLSLLFHKKHAQQCVVTVHDLIPLTPIAQYPFLRRLLFKLSTRGLSHAAQIVADSEHTKQDIIRYLHLPEQRITVIPLGVDTTIFKPRNMKKKPLSILYVGSEEPRKNFSVLLKAFALLKKKLPQAKLINVGTAQWPDARQKSLELMYNLGLYADDVVFKGYVDNLVVEYNRAEVFVFPSLYEGFGLPVLESMACGTPVICSSKTSLPEIGSDAVLYFDGNNTEVLAERLYAVLTQPQLRQELRTKGFEQAKKFTWEKCIRETMKVYNKVFKRISIS